MRTLWAWLWARRIAAAGLATAAVFTALVAQFWHPYYGFTRFLQLDEHDARVAVSAMRAHPVFVYPGADGYDGFSYAQVAFHPLLDSPELQPAIGNVPYRARRILGSALAWLIAGGDAAYIANVYSSLNVVLWAVLALLLWRVLPVTDARSWAAWLGVVFSAGALHSVRLALTDLLGATLVAAAIVLSERRRTTSAVAVMGLAGLARETAVANVVALWRGPWSAPRAWLGNLARALLVAVPIVAWMVYVRWKAGPADQGFGNFEWPLAGWFKKWGELAVNYAREPDFRWLNTTSLLALVGLTAQAAYFLRRIRLEQPWWRAGIVGVALMTMLGTAVWEGHPGAATRVLLPMTVAFAVLAVRERASWRWIVLGGLPVFSGVLALWHVAEDPRELASGRVDGGAYVVHIEEGWFGMERHKNTVWSWGAGDARLVVHTTRVRDGAVQVSVKLGAVAPRPIEIRDADAVLWRGEVGRRPQWITFPASLSGAGSMSLVVRSDAAPVLENEHADARALSFAAYDLRLE